MANDAYEALARPHTRARKTERDEVPPGATRRAFDREDNGGVTPGSPLGDRHAAGEPGGGTETGGLGGSNVGDGSPVVGKDVVER